jgi:hypothetical protein
MLTTGQQQEHHGTAITRTAHAFALAYIVAGCIFAVGVYKGYYDYLRHCHHSRSLC